MMQYKLRGFSAKEQPNFRVSFSSSISSFFCFKQEMSKRRQKVGSGNTASSTTEEAAHLCEIFANVL